MPVLRRVAVQGARGGGKEEILTLALPHQGGGDDFETQAIRDIAAGKYRAKTREQIRGSGYVVDCLEAALWCFDKTASFREAILEAANLGEDADTTAAVCGQIAGAYYGVDSIPASWRERVVMADQIVGLADRLCHRSA